MSKATFPNTTSNVRKLSSSEYKSWWAKVHGKYLEDNLQSLVAAVGPITDILQEHNEEVFADKSLALKSKAVLPHKNKGPPCTDVQKEKMLPQAYQASKKRPPQDESDRSHGDRCPKRFRPPVDEPRDTTSHAVEIHDSDSSSSRTLTATKEPSSVNILVASHQSKPQDSSESVAGPDSWGSLPTSKSEREATSISHGRSKPNLGLSSRKPPATTMSIFYGRKVVMTLRKNFILEAWTKIQAKFSNLSVDCASSLEDEVKVILEEMDGKDLDISPLKKLLDSFFELSTSYDQARSALVDKARRSEKSSHL
ncbi:uncharacterized protein LOC132042997 [Lycium ferocissimum]|uniref:uncharacterized protein LOC132042997 n=1 Tax=Lycium ferocissimum TaxID=112874 RepID=UPI002814BD4F|nr:uncharacterized protein LOC132042997 [Lycium ferocissimum]